MPRKIAGIEMITIDALIDAIRMPSVAADSATHLYGGCRMQSPPVISCLILTISSDAAASAVTVRRSHKGAAMPEFASYEQGTPCWVQLSTDDINATFAFYGALFGWEAEDTGPDMGQ